MLSFWFAVAYGSGLRREEILNLTWPDIDFANNQIKITAKDTTAKTIEWEPKDHEMRIVPMSNQAIQLLDDMRLICPEQHHYPFISPARLKRIRKRITAGTWNPICQTQNNLIRDFEVIQRRAGIPKCTLHDLRRSAITNWSQYLQIQVVQQLAGHSNITTTRKYYLMVRSEDTLYENSQIGMMKVEALQEKIQREYPGTSVHPYPYNVGEVPDLELLRLIQRSLVVILAIDDPVQILRIHDLAYPIVELIQIAMHRQAASGHIALTIPYVTPCLRCTLGLNEPGDLHQLNGEPGNGWHIRRVAHEGAAIALDLMYAKLTGRSIQRWDTSCNLIYIANARQEISPDGPGQHYEASQRRPDCRLCHPDPAV